MAPCYKEANLTGVSFVIYLVRKDTRVLSERCRRADPIVEGIMVGEVDRVSLRGVMVLMGGIKTTCFSGSIWLLGEGDL